MAKRKSDVRKLTEEARHQMILEGLADVDAGRLIDDSKIEAWIKSLETDIFSPPRSA